ncbi:MAG: ATP-binding protein, partial [Actinomycetales bacterium]
MSDGLFSRVELATSSLAGYRLHHLEVFNWGTFDRQVWRLTPSAQTALLTGDIGSGKSTLVDALTTLLLPSNRIAYNKAAGADSKERTLRSYVEGHYKSERIEKTGRSRPVGLRSDGRTYSVILGVFVNEGYDDTVTLAQVFQQRESTGQPYRFYVTAPKRLSIAADFADFGSDLRDLRKRLRSAGADVFDDFPKYGVAFRRLLGIRSEQALELFHQTVSMKSVGNLNDFVRDHMLEPSDATERVRDIVAHFDNLTSAHDAVKRAREQLAALEPVAATAAKYDATLAERDETERQRDAVKLFIAELRASLLATEIAGLESDVTRLTGDLASAKQEHSR